jgi:F0F1-type ATP synthase membrane subunit b/b'
MSGHPPHKDHNAPGSPAAALLGAALLTGAGYLAYSHLDAVIAVGDRYFKLTPADLAMIPVGALLFTALWQLLRALLFEPHLRLLQEREAAGSGALAAAARAAHKADLLVQDYDQKVFAARVAAARERSLELHDAKQKAEIVFKQAQQQAQQVLTQSRSELAVRLEEMRAALLPQVEEFAETIMRKAAAPPQAPKQIFH